MKRRKWQKKGFTGGGSARSFVFTQQTLRIALAALDLFDQPLQQTDRQNERIIFAEATTRQVRSKLEQMQQSVREICLVTFDYNEKIILTTAIRLYALDLLALSPDEARAQQLQHCEQMVHYFAKGLPNTLRE